MDLRRRPLRHNWRLWGGLAALIAAIVLLSWQPTDVYSTVNYCSWCYLGWTPGVGVTGGWGVGTLGALIGWVMLAATFAWATWRPERAAPSSFRLVPVGVLAGGALVVLLNISEVLSTATGLLSLNLAFGAPAWMAGVFLLWRWFAANGADLSVINNLVSRFKRP